MQSNANAQLTDSQIQQLAEIVVSVYGSDLAEAALAEAIALLLEDISGFELASVSIVHATLNAIRSKYYECCNE